MHPCGTLVEVCRILVEVCRILVEVCRTLVEVCRTLVEVCRILVEVCRAEPRIPHFMPPPAYNKIKLREWKKINLAADMPNGIPRRWLFHLFPKTTE
jgi:hypothetical protein